MKTHIGNKEGTQNFELQRWHSHGSGLPQEPSRNKILSIDWMC